MRPKTQEDEIIRILDANRSDYLTAAEIYDASGCSEIFTHQGTSISKVLYSMRERGIAESETAYVNGRAMLAWKLITQQKTEQTIETMKTSEQVQPDTIETLLNQLKSEIEKVRGGSIESKYKSGQRVIKSGGDYFFTGVITCVFTKLSGQIRYTVENPEGIVHIFSEKQLDACEKV